MDSINKIISGFNIKSKYSKTERNPNIWLFGEWFGERCNDNSMYLANYICEKHPEINVFWSAKKSCNLSKLNQNVHIVYFGTRNALNIYKRAGAVFMNQGFNDFSETGYNYFGNAITVNLWHGVMWKKIGHDGSRRRNAFYQIYKRLEDFTFGADKYVATSDEYAKVCQTAFGAHSDGIIRTGYPRNSIFYDKKSISTARHEVLIQLKKETGLEWNDDVTIITYMPTFRDKKENTFSFEQLSVSSDLSVVLNKHNAIILQKAHFINQKRNRKEDSTYSDRVFEFNNIDAQILLAATDLLITDYSSCFFDFLLLNRPIIHYIYDYDYYASQDRGLYYKYEDVCCGDVIFEQDKLAMAIDSNLKFPNMNSELRKNRLAKFMKYESPTACEQIYDYVYQLL